MLNKSKILLKIDGIFIIYFIFNTISWNIFATNLNNSDSMSLQKKFDIDVLYIPKNVQHWEVIVFFFKNFGCGIWNIRWNENQI